MKYYVYYLYSDSLNKFYIGKTDSTEKRLIEHNNGKEIYTRRGVPWVLVNRIECKNSIIASQLERKLKKAKNREYVKWYFEKNGQK